MNFFLLTFRDEDEDDDEDDATSLVSSHTLTDETANGESTTSKSKRSTSLTSSEECSSESNKVNNEENLNGSCKDADDNDDDNISLKSKAENYSVDTPLSLRKAKELVAEVKRNDATLKRITKADISLEAKHKMRNAHLSASNATLTNVRRIFVYFSLQNVFDFLIVFFCIFLFCSVGCWGDS